MVSSFYLASRYDRREEMQGYAHRLMSQGDIVTAKWVFGAEEGMTREAITLMDFDDVERATSILVFSDPKDSLQLAGGRHTELGLALAWGKRVYLIGPQEQIFHHYPSIRLYDDFDDFYTARYTSRSETRLRESSMGLTTLGCPGGSSKGSDIWS